MFDTEETFEHWFKEFSKAKRKLYPEYSKYDIARFAWKACCEKYLPKED